MNNLLDYIDWRGELSFLNSPLNELDLYLFSQIAVANLESSIHIPLTGISFGSVLEKYTEKHTQKDTEGVLQSKYVNPMMFKLVNSKRFSELKVSNQVNIVNNKNVEQFSALTFVLPDGDICISIRGTDDTITGWKENCNLAILETVPAQADALNYLEEMAKLFPFSSIWICGHSKGGNLAVSCAVRAEESIRKRIAGVYSFDGPGFTDSFFLKPEYKELEGRIVTVVSQNSTVGLLMKTAGRIEYVKSTVFGPLAHDGFYWEVLGTSFVKAEGLSPFSKTLQEALNNTIGSMTTEERIRFTEELFGALFSKGADTITDLKKMSIPDAIAVMSKVSGSKAVRAFINGVIGKIGKETFEKALKIDQLTKAVQDFHE